MSTTQRTSLPPPSWVQEQHSESESPNWLLDNNVGVTRQTPDSGKSKFPLDVDNIGTNFPDRPDRPDPPGEDNEKSNRLNTAANGQLCPSPSIGSESTLFDRGSQRSQSMVPPPDEDGSSMPPSSQVKQEAPPSPSPSQELPTIVTDPPRHTERQPTTFPQRMSRAQARLTNMRDRAVARRDNLRQSRQKIRTMRRQAGDLEAQLVKLLQQNRANPQELKTDEIVKIYTNLQDKRDKLGHAEMEYDEDEAAYEVLETRLDAMESDFYDDLAEGLSEVDGVSLAYSSRPSTPQADQSFSPSSSRAQTLLDQYLQKTTEISMLKEKLGEMQQEKEDVLQERQMCDRHGWSLAEADISFLDEFDHIYHRMDEELQALEKEVQSMQEEDVQLKFQTVRRNQVTPPPTASEPSILITHPNPSPPGPVTTDNEVPKALSDTDEITLPNAMMNTRFRVTQWVMEQILTNPTLRLKHGLELSHLRRSKSSDKEWWDLLRRITVATYFASPPHSAADELAEGCTSAYTATV